MYGEWCRVDVLRKVEGRDGFEGEGVRVVGVRVGGGVVDGVCGGLGEGCSCGDLDWQGGGAGVGVRTGILIGGGEVAHRRWTDASQSFRSILD